MNLREFNPSKRIYRRANKFADENNLLFFLFLISIQTLYCIGKFISPIRTGSKLQYDATLFEQEEMRARCRVCEFV